MSWWVEDIVKLLSVSISGAYVAYPSLLPSPPKEIKELLSERECYIVTTVREKSRGEQYLLACQTKVGKSLDFYYYFSTSSKASRNIAIPVKYLSDLGREDKGTEDRGEEEKKQIFDLSFTYGGNFTMGTNTFNTTWMDGLKKEFYLLNFCKQTQKITQIAGHSKKALKCFWTINGKEGESYWPEYTPPAHNQVTKREK